MTPHDSDCPFRTSGCTCGNTLKNRLVGKDVEIERLRKVLGNILWMLQGDRTREMLGNLTAYVERSLGTAGEAKPEQPQELGEHPIG